ncbi:hypothetical protein P7H19_10635 [Paenibacillus larvae]|nr:hypothetical protein [Paenibacillus larvae]MDT2236662.1 hypothetical protein [Paenibacillus larvae]
MSGFTFNGNHSLGVFYCQPSGQNDAPEYIPEAAHDPKQAWSV